MKFIVIFNIVSACIDTQGTIRGSEEHVIKCKNENDLTKKINKLKEEIVRHSMSVAVVHRITKI